jgi:NADH:ubiquinone oxidoreductase subunit C
VSKISASDFVKAFQEAHTDVVQSIGTSGPKRADLLVKLESVVEVATSLRDNFGFIMPVSAGAIDYPNESRFQMIYYLFHPTSRFLLTFRVNLPRENPKMPSLTKIWEAMSFSEREAHDMFGIEFEGHPNMIPILISPDWRGGYPLRKDFKGEGQQ